MGKGGVKKKQDDSCCFIIRGHSKTYHSQKVTVSFEPSIPKSGFVHPSMRDMNDSKPALPTFNFDQIHYTPAFTIPSQSKDTQYYLNKHKGKLQQYSEVDKDYIMVAKPKDKLYCHVCQICFGDYLEHVQSEKHLLTVAQNKFQRRIRKLCRKYRKKNDCQRKSQKQCKISQEEQSNSRGDSKENHRSNSFKAQIQA